ncbi:MAG TPA: histidine kinase N-terminal 7TM domain-containing protein [Bacillota bacterium]|nr:histidine kinase N-terminal 7TM domain-containing protein [Bacillota bacterium]
MNLPIHDIRVILPFLTALLSVFLIAYFLSKGKKTSLLFTYILLQAFVVIWASGQVWEMLADNLQSRWPAVVLTVLGYGFAGFGWLLFCGFYTGNQKITKKRNIYLLLAPPVLSYCGVLTNKYHHLFIITMTLGKMNSDYDIIYWFIIATTYLYILTGIIIMIKYAISQLNDSRNQSLLLIISALIPLLTDILAEIGIIMNIKFIESCDLTLYSVSFSLLLFGVVSFKYRFLNIIPVAWQKIMNHMKESMMIIDRNGLVVNYNCSFEKNFPEFIQTGTEDLNIFTKQLSNRSDNIESAAIINAIQHGERSAISGELTLITPEWRCFSVYIQPILSQRGEIQGRIVLFNDVTQDKKMLQELHNKNSVMSVMNQELATANKQLKDYARTVEELAVAQERNRITRDIHDSVGHQMTLLIALLEVTTDLYEKNRPETKTKLLEATVTARESLQELRRSIRHQTENQDLLESLQKLIANFEASGIQIDFSVEGSKRDIQPRYAEVLYRICQEALTNAVRHGKARQAAIVLRFNFEMIGLDISDNGQGCQKITKGMGLTGMEGRVQELNGTIKYGSSEDGGFSITVKIPIK